MAGSSKALHLDFPRVAWLLPRGKNNKNNDGKKRGKKGTQVSLAVGGEDGAAGGGGGGGVHKRVVEGPDLGLQTLRRGRGEGRMQE